MATSLNLLSKVVGNKVEGLFKSDEPEKTPPSEKELKVNSFLETNKPVDHFGILCIVHKQRN